MSICRSALFPSEFAQLIPNSGVFPKVSKKMVKMNSERRKVFPLPMVASFLTENLLT